MSSVKFVYDTQESASLVKQNEEKFEKSRVRDRIILGSRGVGVRVAGWEWKLGVFSAGRVGKTSCKLYYPILTSIPIFINIGSKLLKLVFVVVLTRIFGWAGGEKKTSQRLQFLNLRFTLHS